MIHVSEQRLVHPFHGGPVAALHVLHIEIVALIAPPFIEDLSELRPWIHEHAKRGIHPPRAGLRYRAIRVHQMQRPVGPRRPIEQLPAISADRVLRDALGERCCTPCAQLVPMQRVARAESATGGPGYRCRFEEEHGAGRTRLQQVVIAFRDSLHGKNALSDAIKIDADRTRRC